METIQQDGLVIAVEGCLHGQLDLLYHSVHKCEQLNNIKIDLVICCGDFQAIRDHHDLQFMSCPDKYKQIGDFQHYFKGTKVAPYLTIFIGGNHEASNFLQELYFGGWVCPNIYYLGMSGVINIVKSNKVYRLGGISGIFNRYSYRQPRDSVKMPLKHYDIKSVYHYKEFDIMKLYLYQPNIDIFVSHDWPNHIYQFGDQNRLLRVKKFFKDDINTHRLGSPLLLLLLQKMDIKYWFSGHLHVKFAAIYNKTKFLALDKCLPRRQFLQIVSVQTERQLPAEYQVDMDSGIRIIQDEEWLNLCSKVELANQKDKSLFQNLVHIADYHQNTYQVDQYKCQKIEQLIDDICDKKYSQEQLQIKYTDLNKIGIFDKQTYDFLDLLGVDHHEFKEQFEVAFVNPYIGYNQQSITNNQNNSNLNMRNDQIESRKDVKDENEIDLGLD